MIAIHVFPVLPFFSADTAKAVAAINKRVTTHNREVANLLDQRKALLAQFAERSAPAKSIVAGLDSLRVAELAAIFECDALLVGKAALRSASRIDSEAEQSRLIELEAATRAKIEADFRASGADTHFLPGAVAGAPAVKEIKAALLAVRDTGTADKDDDRRIRGELDSLMDRKSRELFG